MVMSGLASERPPDKLPGPTNRIRDCDEKEEMLCVDHYVDWCQLSAMYVVMQ